MFESVVIHSKDRLKVYLECSTLGVAREIAEHFSFYVPGYKFMPKYKSGRWDGKIKMFDMRTGEFYKGLLPKLVEWLKDNEYTVGIADKEALKPKIPFDPEWLNRWAEYGRMEPKPHQVKAIKNALTLNEALIMSPTGSGKSYIMYMIVRYILENSDEDILITVPTTSLVEQLFSDFEDYSRGLGWNAGDHLHKIYSGREKTPIRDYVFELEGGKRVIYRGDQLVDTPNGKVKAETLKTYEEINEGWIENIRILPKVFISTWQSIFRLEKNWFSRFGAYLCDEAHGADAKSISSIVDKIAHAPIRIGLTGTLDGTILHELEMLARFGPVVKATSTSKLMKTGDLSRLSIDCLRLEYHPDERKYVKNLNYQQEIDFLVTHERRNKILVNAALREKKNTLMLFHYIDKHGAVLYRMLKEKAEKFGKKVFYISGSVAVDERERIRQILEKENNCILLASYGTYSTGINVKNLHTIIFCHPFKAKIKTLQSIGRGLRTMSGKDGAKLIDIADDLVYKPKKGKEIMNTTMKHFIERLKVYQSEQFDYKIIPIDIGK